MLWTGGAAAASESFKELLLELAQERSLGDLLPIITRRLVEHEDVALARLWLLAPGDLCTGCPNASACADRTRCLHLVASAARGRDGVTEVHDRLDGAFRRIPIGAFKVGQVAKNAAPVLVTDPATDAKIRRPDWVRAEGIAGFAGLPLNSRGQLVGVLGVFVRAPIGPAAVDVLQILANHAAAAIATAQAFAEVEVMRRQLLLENQLLRQGVHDDGFEELVGHSDKLREVLRSIDAVAPTDASVLVLGESGTGKELVARALHRRSHRHRGPFIEVNCAAIARELCESELFGHVKGAFSGAVKDRIGRFEAASGGTLFLDELGELPLELQGKLLRVLQEGTYERVGEVRTRRADVRLVAATNRDLFAEVERGRFRQDLYYRLAVFPIALPPLRARKEDLPDLAAHLLGRICRRLHRPLVTLGPALLHELARRDWPGNVRELRNVLERAVISSGEGVLTLPFAQGPSSARLTPEAVRSVAPPVPEFPVPTGRRGVVRRGDASARTREPAPRPRTLSRQDLRQRRGGRAARGEADHPRLAPQTRRAGVTLTTTKHRGSLPPGSVVRIVRAMQPRAVLLVNDDADFLEALSTTLEGEGFPVVTARGADEALERLQYTQPVLIVTDFQAHDEDSLDLLSLMRERGLYEDVPKLVISGDAPEVIEARLAAAHLQLPFLHKLTDLTLVLHAVHDAFDASLLGAGVYADA